MLLIGSIGYIPPVVEAKAAADWARGLNGAMGWNEDTYYTIEKRTGNNNWIRNQAANTYDQNNYGISGGRGMVWLYRVVT